MKKGIMSNLIGFTTLVILLFGFQTALEAETQELKISKGSKTMIITKDVGKDLAVKGDDARGNIRDLQIHDGTKVRRIIDIDDGTIIESEGSQCTWYFYNGKYYIICY
jgi:hypothetical protein